MRIVVISLRNATRRRTHAAQQLGRLGLRYEFFDAVPGETSVAEAIERVDRRAFQLETLREPVAGEIGCYLSHCAVWQDCIATGKPILVLEDDFELQPRFAEALPVVEHLIERYPFLRLEPIVRRRAPLKRLRPAAYSLGKLHNFRLHYVSDVPACLTGYAIAPVAARRLVAASHTIIGPIDKLVQRTWDHGVPVHSISPAPVKPAAYACASTIGDRKRSKRWSPGLMLARAAYKAIGEIRRLRFDRSQLAIRAQRKRRDLDGNPFGARSRKPLR